MKKGLVTLAVVLILTAIITISSAISSADGCPCLSSQLEPPSPLNGSPKISIYTSLNWSSCPNASSYYVHFGTSDPPTTYNWSAPSNGYQLPFQLNYNTKYYWQITAYNATCNTSGPVWNFSTDVVPPPTPTATPCTIPTKPQSPSPTSGITNTSTTIVLNWNASANASYYEVYYDTFDPPTYKGLTYSTNYSLPQLNINTKYYWQIIAWNPCGPNPGDVWNFTTGCPTPSRPTIPSPTNGSDQVSLHPYLSWNGSANASSYYVYFGTSATPSYYGNTSNSSFQLPKLNSNTRYYWRVAAGNACGNNSSDIWTFTTGCPDPGIPQGPSPTNNSDQVSLYTNLRWNASPNASYYEVYFGTSAVPDINGSVGSTINNSYTIPSLNVNTKYYWKVIAKNECGINSSNIWSFTTGCPVPDKPQIPSPINNSEQISINAYLSWNASPNASSYDVYFGTSSPPAYYGNASNSSYQLPQLNQNTQYYWKVAATNACGNNSSEIWSFSTGCPVPDRPQLSYPANDATFIAMNVTLNWSACANASSYDLYLSTSSPPAFFGHTSNTSYQVSLPYDGMKYYWNVVANSLCGSNSSDTWSFFSVIVSANTPGVTPSSTPSATPSNNHDDNLIWLWIVLALDGTFTLVMLGAIVVITRKRGQKKQGVPGKKLSSLFRIPFLRRTPKPPEGE